MTPFHAWREGLRRVLSAPSVLVAVWVLTTLVAVPRTLAIRDEIAGNLGRALASDAAPRGMTDEWMQESAGHGTGLAATVRPTIMGFAGVLPWVFLSGGIIDRYMRNRATGTRGFSAACGACFFRLLRLAIITAIVDGLLFGALHPWLFSRLYVRLVFLLCLAAVNIVFDFAEVRAVVEDRRSMVLALVASWRFIRSNPAKAIGVYLLNAVLFGLVLGAYSYLAPTGGNGVRVLAAVMIGHVYLFGRLCVRLLFFASETALVMATLTGSPYVRDARTASTM